MSILKAGRPSTSKEKALREVQKEPTVRLNVIITKSFHKQIKQRALDEEITVTELIHKAVNEYMSK
jgi:predicted HicB family RNase H-like nuclease